MIFDEIERFSGSLLSDLRSAKLILKTTTKEYSGFSCCDLFLPFKMSLRPGMVPKTCR